MNVFRVVLACSSLLLGAAVLSGCSAVGDIAGEQLGAVGCAIVTPVVEQAARDAQTAVADIPVDPAAARANLEALSGVLTIAAGQLDGQASGDALLSADEAVQELIKQAASLEAGGTLDKAQLDVLSERFTSSLADASGVC